MIKLYNFQKEYMKHVKPNFIYSADTGTGKTIMGLEHHQRYYKDKKLIIVAPASKINEGGWQRTIDEHYPHIKYETCTYNMLPKKYKKFENTFVIFDEVHRLKNSTGVWGRSGYLLTKIAAGFIGLSATPIPNGWEDAINYFKMFNLTKNKTQFIRNNAVTTIQNGYMEITSWINESKLKNMWNSISRPLLKSKAVDLPELIFKDIYFEVSKPYKEILKKRVYNEVIYDNGMKLRHGLRLNTNLKDKIDYLKEFVENTTDNIVIFYNYDKELELLKTISDKTIYICNGYEKNYPKKGEWKDIKNTITLANYKSGSEAVEFTYANIIIYFSLTESYVEFEQSHGRCHRSGQTNKVTAYRFITKDTIDESISESLNNKKDFNFDIWIQENVSSIKKIQEKI